MRNTFFATVLIAIGLLIGLVAAEALYRGWLYHNETDRFEVDADSRPSVWFFEKSRWTFNERHGFEYGPETVYGGSTSEGFVRSCWSWPANARGNMGIIEGDYDTADLKVLVFGDSFTAQIDTGPDKRGVAWPNFLQTELSERFGRTAHVVNFGRDGYGILQMVDLAADRIAEWKPDVAVFAYITDDLTRDRFWRTYTTAHGHERILTTTVPDPDPPLEFSADTAIVNSAATRAWCEAAVASQDTRDPVLLELEDSVRRARANVEGRASLWSLSHSFLVDRVVHQNAFHSLATRIRPSQNPRHAFNAFEEDERFRSGMARIRATGVPILLVHFSTYEELALGQEFDFRNAQEESLNGSLPAAFGVPIWPTLDRAAPPAAGLEAIKRSPRDSHPSVAGMAFYADVVAQAFEDSGILD